MFRQRRSSRQACIGALLGDDTLSTLPTTLSYEYDHAVYTIPSGQHAAPTASLAPAHPRRSDNEELPDHLDQKSSPGKHNQAANLSTAIC